MPIPKDAGALVDESERLYRLLVEDDRRARREDAPVSDRRILTSILRDGNVDTMTIRTIQTNGKRYKYIVQEDND